MLRGRVINQVESGLRVSKSNPIPRSSVLKVEPCINCPDKVIDNYGYYCDIACGGYSAWLNYREGIKEAVARIRSHQLIKPDGDSITRFEPFYQIEEAELKEWGFG